MWNKLLTQTIAGFLFFTVLTGCSQGSTLQNAIKTGGNAYVKCSQELHSNNLDAANQTCQAGLKAMGGYEHRVKEGLYNLLTTIAVMKGNYSASEEYAKKGATLAAKLEGKDTVYYGWLVAKQGAAQNYLLKFKDAELTLIEAERIMRKEVMQKQHKTTDADYAFTLQHLAMSLVGQGKDKEAVESLDKLLQAKGNIHPTEYEKMMAFTSLSSQIGDEYYAQSNNSQAQKHYERCIDLYEKYKTQSPEAKNNIGQTIVIPFPSTINAMAHLGEIYEKTGRIEDGKKLQASAKQWDHTRTIMQKLDKK